MGVLIGAAIAAALGIWAYSDAKSLEASGIRVGSMSPSGWGWGVALLAIVFGVLYLVQRSQAISSRSPSVRTSVSQVGVRFCTRCGEALQADAGFCSGCGSPT